MGPMLILGKKVLLSEHENNSQLLFLDFSAVVTLWTIYRIDSAVSAFKRCHNWGIVSGLKLSWFDMLTKGKEIIC